jgi:hypothetical protein
VFNNLALYNAFLSFYQYIHFDENLSFVANDGTGDCGVIVGGLVAGVSYCWRQMSVTVKGMARAEHQKRDSDVVSDQNFRKRGTKFVLMHPWPFCLHQP